MEKKLLIFLSHASEDKKQVRNLCKRLRQDGFDPWLDEERLLPGQDWNLEIEKAMRASDAILLCFSSLSVAKEGYIQREYKRARTYLEEKPEGTIYAIPVRLDDCELPQFIREIQWVDYPADYDRLLMSLQVRVGNPAMPKNTLSASVGSRKIDADIAQHIIKFDTLIAEKTNGFVGRHFVFDALDAFLTEEKSGYFVIRGEPGIGKTAIMGQLVKTRNLIHHFNIVQQNIRLPELFLRNVCAQLIVQYELNLTIPEEPMASSILLEQCLREVAANPVNQPLILVLDSLDEAEWRLLPPRVNVHYLPPVLPGGVYFVVSTRPAKDIPLQVVSRRDLDIEPDLEGNLLDIHTYLEAYTRRKGMQTRLNEWGITIKDFIAELLHKSQGNFMYLRYVLPAIEFGRLGHDGVGELPKGLQAYYLSHWAQMKEEVGGYFKETHERVICVLVVMTEPVSLDELSSWTKLERREVGRIIQAWEPFLQEATSNNERLYRLYHARPNS